MSLSFSGRVEPHPTTRHAEIVDVAGTRTLPAYYYTDPAVLEIERDELFFRQWHYVCHAGRLVQPGDYVTGTLFDQDYFLVRGQDGEIRAFYNVCAHRGHRLLDGSGCRNRISCPYHAWTYALDGRLMGLRSSGEDQRFSRSDIRLSGIRVDRILDFIFINLDPDATPLDEFAPGLAESIASKVPDLATYLPSDNADYFGGTYDCNWKVVIDNFLECYHCETAHDSFSDLMDIKNSRFTLHGTYSHQYIPTAGKADNAAFPLDLAEDDLDGHFWFLFPNTFFSVFPGVKNFAVSRSEPDGPGRTRRMFDMMAPSGVSRERQEARSRWGLEVVNEEDRSLCENVQRGMGQRGFSQGYYLVEPDNHNLTEEGVQFFHRLYADALEDKLAANTR